MHIHLKRTSQQTNLSLRKKREKKRKKKIITKIQKLSLAIIEAQNKIICNAKKTKTKAVNISNLN